MKANDQVTRSILGGEWFTGAGFGMFVHWDHASSQGIEIGWPIVGKSIIPGETEPRHKVSAEQYHSSASTFNPEKWNAADLAQMAKDSGAQYVVFTTRHHGGYSMFHTKHSDFGIQHSEFQRDIVREYADAVRAQGLRVGFYYSLSDWHHDDYPKYLDSDRPYKKEHFPEADWEEMAGSPLELDKHRRSTPEQWGRYLDYVRGQITELLTNYGAVDLLWFDGGWERSCAEWDCAGLRELIKSLQPNVIINERLHGFGDYFTPEQSMPAVAPTGPWEMCLTMGRHWGWTPDDKELKSPLRLVRTLIEVTSRGGNLLLNTGIRGDGSIDSNQRQHFALIEEWMKLHQRSVIGVEPASGIDFYGPITRTEKSIYLHLLFRPVKEFTVRGLPVDRIKRVILMATGEELPYTVNFEVHHRFKPGEDRTGEMYLNSPTATTALVDVIEIQLN